MFRLLAAAMTFTLGVGSAYASDGHRQSVPALFASTELQQNHASDDARQTHPLFTIGRMEVRVWAPVAPPYTTETFGDPRP
jgi:hypothetical protein